MIVELSLRQKTATLACITAAACSLSLAIGQRLIPQTLLSALVMYLLSGDRPTMVYAMVRTLPRDLNAAICFIRLNLTLYRWEKRKMTVVKVFEEVAASRPSKVALIMDDQRLTFADVKQLSDRIASYFHSKGFVKGDTVALMMETRTEYPCIWLGLAKLGVVTALINTNLRRETLRHSIAVANSKAIIVSAELAGAVAEVLEQDGIKGLPIYLYGDKQSSDGDKNEYLPDADNLRQALDNVPSVDLSSLWNDVSPRDKLVYIYTSGTTGMPKAAVITNSRFIMMGTGCYYMLSLRDDDIIYNSLPLYHSAGGMVGMGSVLLCGLTAALRKKFSASNFFPDCIKYNCTVAQYIGEICRFVLTTPPRPTDGQHKVRMMFGNGLRPQIWTQFVSRFNINQICEFYGSTEGNSNLMNLDNTVGAVGFVPAFARTFYPVTLVRCEEETGEIIRDPDGFCIRCKPGEPGVFVGKINLKNALSSFVGYADKKASEKKVLRDVFTKGDMFFNSGDILVADLFGYYYFKDRTGDTFRWRGENVATSEVEGVITNIVGLKDCAVYGVDIPGTEGKAGMAAIVDTEGKLDLEQLGAGIRGSLPPYARPLFIRVLSEVPMTTTFKLKKRDLQIDGYDINKIKDPIYFLQPNGSYTRFSAEEFAIVSSGKGKF
ncbi:long-chain fatty acid transport protein 4 [Aedes aegypti]|uniref:Very long-chain fatty acid transport protein n=1 Tax=Aedes aegypti TaxID=7159 RepID=A0A6I8TFG3_AEDAE|nr:long-chain fatty acid transport protein 4 [Aedes aegypti]XP_021704719.1 long-chain fatty acid transport protein 4 [Aedes aegypti]XP_021704720.1 long-chain fatty acid transport protein 4 [Aedes aegypti]XP_021704721.1 long-chain fatty acid transport protein 4 [Aedes aegypti]